MERNFSIGSKRIKLKEKLLKVLILLLFLGFLSMLINVDFWSGTAIPRYMGSRGFQEPGWVFSEGDQVLETGLTTPAFRHMKKGQTYSISTRLTYDGSQDQQPACFFFVDHMFCTVKLEDQVLFSYTEKECQKPGPSKSPGNVYTYVLLPNDCQGMEFTIEFIPALGKSVEFQLPNPHFGDFTTTAVAAFRGDMPHNVVAMLSGFLGIFCVLYSTLALPGDKYREGLFIGIFATLVALYNTTESDWDFYLVSNPYFTYIVDYTTFSLVPIFLMAFLRERLEDKQKPVALVAILIGIGMFLTEMVLHFTGLVDAREFLPVIHVVYFIDFIVIFILLTRMTKSPRKKLLIAQMIPILCGVVIDASVYYMHWQLGSSDSTFTSMGIFFFLLTELYHVWRYSMEVYTLSMQTKDYQKMAYIDALTGIGNRRAFEAEQNVILSGKRKYRHLIVASADLNDLKPTNDTMGHAAGDFLIRSAAEVLSQLAKDHCHAFRMGGDEFAVLVYDMPLRDFEASLRQMRRKILDINEKSEVKLSLAIGYQVVKNNDIVGAVALSDHRMYEDKARIKEKKKARKDK